MNSAEYLIQVIQELSLARTLEGVIDITRRAARALTSADGASFVLRDNDMCHYVDEDAIGPLWKGNRFPMKICISGWAMLHSESVVIPDIYKDVRIPIDAYRPTFVKSLLMVPIRKSGPIGAIGNYWAREHKATEEEIRLLEALANCTSVALENVQLIHKLTEANYSLEKSLFSRDEFLSIASHELRTPISALKLELQMAGRYLKDDVPEGLREPLKRSLTDVDRLAKLVEQLLDVSRIRLGKITIERETVNASEIVQKISSLLAPQLHQAGCSLELEVGPEIYCDWDPLRIEQVMTNLLSNVVRHAPGSKVQVSFKGVDHNCALLTVSDNGPGISLETQGRLFNRFEKGKTTHNVGGLGLGLYIMKNLVEAHGGTIELESHEGLGTTFRVRIPRNQNALLDEPFPLS